MRCGERRPVRRELPQYGIDRIRTGQQRPGERPLREAEFPFGG